MKIYNVTKLLPLLISIALLLILTACGGGGGGSDEDEETTLDPQAQQVTVTLGLQGNATPLVGSVDLDVVLPDGFVLATDSSGQATAAALTFLVAGATGAANYLPATATASGKINAGIIKTDGFPGNADLLQISRTYAAGASLPTANDFMATVVASDLNGATLAGISERISINTQSVP